VEKHCSNPQCFKEKKLQSHIKKIKSTKTILKKKTQKIEKKKKTTILEKKEEKKHVGKVKDKFSTSSILKKNSIKIILKKKHVGKYYNKTKTLWGNIITIHNVLKKKTMKQNQQRSFWKNKKFIKNIKKIYVEKYYSNS